MNSEIHTINNIRKTILSLQGTKNVILFINLVWHLKDDLHSTNRWLESLEQNDWWWTLNKYRTKAKTQAPLVAQTVKSLPAIQETQVWSLGGEDPLEKGMTTHSSILAWKIPWTKEPGRVQFMGLQRVWHNWATNTTTTTNGKAKHQTEQWGEPEMNNGRSHYCL